MFTYHNLLDFIQYHDAGVLVCVIVAVGVGWRFAEYMGAQ